MKNKRILITGIAGSIGSELARQLYEKNKIYGLDINESGLFEVMNELRVDGRVGDIREEITVRDVFSDFKPQIVFHAAALKHVTLCEMQPREALETNCYGVLNVIDYAKRWECVEKLIFISTDKAVNPKTFMGGTKLLGEIMVRNQGFTAVRFGNVLDSRGSLLRIWERQINQGQPITITDERMSRYMMTIQEACKFVIKVSEVSVGGEVFIPKMGNPVMIVDLAKRLVEELGRGEVKTIGIRPGEKLKEELMTAEEKKLALDKGEYYVI